jgi:predicted dehydrogenase
MGAIHAKVYSELQASRLTAVVDTDIDRARKLAGRYGCQAFADSRELLAAGDGRPVDAATVATPTASHLEQAGLFINSGIPVMVEKPLASSVREGKKIVSLARKRNVSVAVGHSERCNPVVQAVKRLNIEPRFIEANRVSPYPFRSTDIGVVLDVMIHDIDIILSLAAGRVKKVDAVGVSVIDEAEDICNARLVFDNGCIASVTASRLALRTDRRVRLFSRQAYLSLDYLKKSGIIIKADPNVDVIKWIKTHRDQPGFNPFAISWPDLLHIEELVIDDKEPLRLEQEAFLRSVVDRSVKPEVSAEEGLSAMKVAEMILAAVRKHPWEELAEVRGQ